MVSIYMEGTIAIMFANSDNAKDWITVNVSSEGYHPNYPNSIIVEPRYLDDLLVGLQAKGIEVMRFDNALGF
ncbi:MAG TPA: hypothetical protein VMV86_00290 [Methanosarcinales archaeon]|nr:hypothetical protein [Methanosarcinales archaeon]